MNMRDKITWSDQDKDTNKECDGIQQQDEWDVQFHGCLTDVIGLGIQ